MTKPEPRRPPAVNLLMDPEVRNQVDARLILQGRGRQLDRLVDRLLRDWLAAGAPDLLKADTDAPEK